MAQGQGLTQGSGGMGDGVGQGDLNTNLQHPRDSQESLMGLQNSLRQGMAGKSVRDWAGAQQGIHQLRDERAGLRDQFGGTYDQGSQSWTTPQDWGSTGGQLAQSRMASTKPWWDTSAGPGMQRTADYTDADGRGAQFKAMAEGMGVSPWELHAYETRNRAGQQAAAQAGQQQPPGSSAPQFRPFEESQYYTPFEESDYYGRSASGGGNSPYGMGGGGGNYGGYPGISINLGGGYGGYGGGQGGGRGGGRGGGGGYYGGGQGGGDGWNGSGGGYYGGGNAADREAFDMWRYEQDQEKQFDLWQAENQQRGGGQQAPTSAPDNWQNTLTEMGDSYTSSIYDYLNEAYPQRTADYLAAIMDPNWGAAPPPPPLGNPDDGFSQFPNNPSGSMSVPSNLMAGVAPFSVGEGDIFGGVPGMNQAPPNPMAGVAPFSIGEGDIFGGVPGMNQRPNPMANVRPFSVGEGDIFGGVPGMNQRPNPMAGVAPFSVGEGDIFGGVPGMNQRPNPMAGVSPFSVGEGDIFGGVPGMNQAPNPMAGVSPFSIGEGDIFGGYNPMSPTRSPYVTRPPVVAPKEMAPAMPNPFGGMIPMGNILSNIGALPAPYAGTSGFGGY